MKFAIDHRYYQVPKVLVYEFKRADIPAQFGLQYQHAANERACYQAYYVVPQHPCVFRRKVSEVFPNLIKGVQQIG